MRDPLDRGELLGPDAAAAGRHLHLLVPAEQRRRAVEILDLGDALLQLCKCGLHRAEPYLRQRRRAVGEATSPEADPRSFRDLGAIRDLLPQIPVLIAPPK